MHELTEITTHSSYIHLYIIHIVTLSFIIVSQYCVLEFEKVNSCEYGVYWACRSEFEISSLFFISFFFSAIQKAYFTVPSTYAFVALFTLISTSKYCDQK